MNFNSGSRIVFIAFIICICILILLLILIAVSSKKKNKTPAVLKVFSLLFALIVLAGSFVFPLTYLGDIPLDLKYGMFRSYNHADYLVIHRDSIELHKDGVSEGLKGTYTLRNDVLEITYKDGTTDKFIVKHMGVELVDAETNNKAYKYVKN